MRLLLGLIAILVCFPASQVQPQDKGDLSVARENPSTIRKNEIKDIVDEVFDRRVKAAIQEEVDLQEDRRFRQLGWFLALVGIVGGTGMLTLANYLIEKAVETRLERRTGNITEALDFSSFYLLTLKLKIGKGFTQSDVNIIMNYLRKVEKNSDRRHSTDFTAALHQVMSSFAAATKSASIDELFVSYEQEILGAPSLVSPLLHHYGQEIVGRDGTPQDDVGYRAFEKLERVATSAHVPELALSYRVLTEAAKTTKESVTIVSQLLHSSTKLTKDDRVGFWYGILRRSRYNNWMLKVTPQGSNIETRVREFVGKYKDVIVELYGMDEAEADAISKEGISDNEAKALALRMCQ